MAKLDANAVVTFIVRLIVSFGFIILMLVLFFSFRVGLVNDDMQRFDMEMANTLASSQLTSHRNIFSAEKLFAASQLPQVCEYEYSVSIESVGARKTCRQNSDCIDFCKEVLNTQDPEYDCNFELFGQNFCECKGSDGWQDGYQWKFGKAQGKLYNYKEEKFPTAIETKTGAVLPATVTITSYDSFLSRISCIAQKAYETKSNYSMVIDVAKMPPLPSEFVSRNGDVCIHVDASNTDWCREMDVPVKDFDLQAAALEIAKTTKGKITAYPLKTDADCNQAKNDVSVIAGFGDNVQTIILCA